MPALSNYQSPGGACPTTASLAGALAHSGHNAQHTERSYSEDLLMGVAGGAAFGYFSFAYEGHDPQANIVTRNTFANYGWDAAVERLGLVQDVMHSTSPAKAEQKLIETLEAGEVPIVWVDVFSLGYESSEQRGSDSLPSMRPNTPTSPLRLQKEWRMPSHSLRATRLKARGRTGESEGSTSGRSD